MALSRNHHLGFDSPGAQGLRRSLKTGASLAAVGALLASAGAYAQDNTPAASDANATGDNEIVVSGIRQSLANSQQIKRDSDTVVDAITAQDIGALPDRSVTEALQRVPGVAINRFAGSNDPDHFSVEGSGVVIRGLNFVRSEFNGRDAFSAGVGGQALNFADVPSELLGSVIIAKNATADMIEGGLAGTVNLNTRKPFDNKGFHVSFDAEGSYGDMEKKWAPTGSLLVSDTWETGDGSTFGVLADVSYSRIRSRSDGIQVTNFQTRDATFVTFQSQGGQQICRNQLPASTDSTTLPPGGSFCGAPETAGADGLADLLPVAYAPLGGQFRTQDYDRERQGIALAAQWESPDHDSVFTAQFIRSHTSNAWGEHTFETAPDLSEYNTYPLGCHQNGGGSPTSTGGATTRAECRIDANGNFFFSGNDQGQNYNPLAGQTFDNYQYDSTGLFESGYITLPGSGWRTANSGGGDSNWVPSGGLQQSLSRRQVLEKNTNNDFGVNFQTKLGDRWDLNLDGDYTKSRHTNHDVSVFGSTFADEELDLTGNLPVVIPHKPNTLSATWAAPNSTIAAESDAEYFADQRVQFWRAAMDHFEDSDGHEVAFKADLTYHFDDGSFLRDLKFGARYADRQQTVRYTTYNWGALSEVWSGTAVSLDHFGGDRTDFYTFPNFFRGKTPGPVGGYYYNGNLIRDYEDSSEFFKAINDVWHAPTAQGGGGAGAANRWLPAGERANAIAGTPYLPSEIQKVGQTDYNFYAMLSFQAPDNGGLRLSGNVGARLVSTDVSSFGTTTVPTQATLGITQPFETTTDPVTGVVTAGRCDPSVPAGSPPGTPARRPGGVCALGAAGYALLQQWSPVNPVFISSTAKTDYTYILPSLNLKLGVTDDVIMRFAASKVLTRPDSAYIRNFLVTGVDGNGQLNASVGNPFLKPATAWQFDLTAEWYFSRVGSLTFDVFYKDVKNFFFQSVVDFPITNNGITFPVSTRGPANYDGHGKIKGFEVAYQQTFDFLPGLLSGFGMNANYSYVQSSGLPNTFLNTGSPVNIGSIKPGNLPLEGLSKHNFNVTAFYEKGPVSARVAYNWRSKFLLTAADVIFPYTSIFNAATGQLDASLFFNVTKNIKIGVQGVNLLNEVTKTLQAYTGDPNLLAPRSYFMNDRRYSFILRGSF